MKKFASVSILAGLAVGAPALAQDSVFNLGNVIVAQIGDGSGTLNGNATAVTLREFLIGPNTFTGGDSLALPSGASGRRVTSSGSATSEGFLTLSTDSNYLTYQGYDASAGTAGIATTAAATTNRVVARVGFDLSLDTSTALTDAYSGGNIRSSVLDGANVYMSGTASGSGGARSAAFGGTTSTNLSGTLSNVRVVNMSGGTLYASAASSPNVGISVISGGVATLLFGTGTGSSPYDFVFGAGGAVYVADDRSVSSGGGLQKWIPNGSGGYTLTYTLNAGLGTTGLRGLAFDSATGTFYATTTETNANRLVAVQDTGAAASFSVLATADANKVFRGVEMAPAPTPGTLALLGIGGLATARRRRR